MLFEGAEVECFESVRLNRFQPDAYLKFAKTALQIHTNNSNRQISLRSHLKQPQSSL